MLDGSNPQFPFTFPTVFGLVKARLEVTATTTAVMGQAPQIRFETTVEAVTSAAASISTAVAANDLAVTAAITAEALGDAAAQSSLTVTATLTGEAVEEGRSDGSLEVTVTPTAEGSANYPSAAEFSAQASASAEVLRDASATSALDSYALPAVLAVNSTTSSAETEVSASASSESLRDATAASSLNITAELSAEALETGRGEGFLSITSSTGAEASVDHPFTAELAAEVSQSADAHRTANADSSLDLSLTSRKPFPFYFPFVLGGGASEALRDARVDADLAIQVFITQNISTNIVAFLAILAEGSGTGYLYAPVDDVPTEATATPDASGTKLGRAEAATDVSATSSSSLSKDAGVVAALDISFASTAEMRCDAVVGSAFDASVDTVVIGVENDYAASESSFTALFDADLYRVAPFDTTSEFSATTSGLVDRDARSQSQSLDITISAGGVIAIPQRIDTLYDRFNSKDTDKWTWGPAAEVDNGSLLLPCNQSTTGRIFSRYSAETGYPWWKFSDGCVVSAHLIQTPNIGNGTTSTTLSVDEVGSDQGALYATWRNGQWKFSQSGGTETSVSDSLGSWVRIRSEGGTIFWDVSPDGITWTNCKSEAVAGSYIGCSVNLWSDSGSEQSPGSARWDDFNVVPVTTAASLSITATASGDSQRGQYFTAELLVTVEPTGIGRCDANAQSYLFALVDPSAVPLKILNGSADLAVTADPSSDGFENTVADTAHEFTFSAYGELSRGQGISVKTDVSADATAEPSRGQYLSAIPTSVDFSSLAEAVNNASARAALGVTCQADSDSRRTQYVDASLEALVSEFIEGFTQEFADAETFISAQAAAVASLNRSIASLLSVTALANSIAVFRRNIDASLSVLAEASFDVTEPREIVYVEEDVRSVAVQAVSRASSVNRDDRTVAVVAAESRRSEVTAESRLSSVLIDVRKVYVSAAERYSEVPAEDSKATI